MPKAPLDWLVPGRTLIGMVHVGALPGAPRAALTVQQLAEQAASEARTLVAAGFDAVMIENMHDAPYVNGPHGPEITAAMTAVGLAVRESIGPKVPLGVQVLSGGWREAMAVALAVGGGGGRFVRVENFVYSHVADEGLMAEAVAGPLLRYRRAIGAEHVAILADIKKKHASHALTGDLTIGDCAHAAEFFGADGVIVTGALTGRAADEADLRAARAACTLPVLVGSGVTAANARAMLGAADAVIVGSSIKADGHWSKPVHGARAKAVVKAARSR